MIYLAMWLWLIVPLILHGPLSGITPFSWHSNGQMGLHHRLAKLQTVPLCPLAGEDFITAHPEFGPRCHAQSEGMFCAAGVKTRIVARAFRRLTMAMLVRSGAGVTFVPGAFARTAMDGIVTQPLSAGEHRKCVAAAYPDGDLVGTIAQFLRIARTTVRKISTG